MKNILRFSVMIAACLIFAGCPNTDPDPTECDASSVGEDCASVDNGCVCIDEVNLNGAIWTRGSGQPDIQFPIDSRNMNRIEVELSNYDPALGNQHLRLRADLNGDGEIGSDEIFLSRRPDQNGVVSVEFPVPSGVAGLQDGLLDLELDGFGPIIPPRPLCIAGPRCYIQIGSGGTTGKCNASLTHWEDFRDAKDCFYTVDGQLPVSVGMSFDASLVSPGSTIPVQVTSLKYLDTGAELIAFPVLANIELEAAPMGGFIYNDTANFINFAVPVDGSIGAGNYEITVEILNPDICDGVFSQAIEFELVNCPDCRR